MSSIDCEPANGWREPAAAAAARAAAAEAAAGDMALLESISRRCLPNKAAEDGARGDHQQAERPLREPLRALGAPRTPESAA